MVFEAVGALQRLLPPQEVVDRAHGSHGDVVVADVVVVVVFGAFGVSVEDGFYG